jgi:hypothetical protein
VLENFKVILKAKDIDPVYQERTRQQVIHLAWKKNPEAEDMVGKIDSSDCPCSDCNSFFRIMSPGSKG